MGIFDKLPKLPKPPAVRINPATGLRMIGGRIGGVDVGGNLYGQKRNPPSIMKPNPFRKKT